MISESQGNGKTAAAFLRVVKSLGWKLLDYSLPRRPETLPCAKPLESNGHASHTRELRNIAQVLCQFCFKDAFD